MGQHYIAVGPEVSITYQGPGETCYRCQIKGFYKVVEVAIFDQGTPIAQQEVDGVKHRQRWCLSCYMKIPEEKKWIIREGQLQPKPKELLITELERLDAERTRWRRDEEYYALM